MATPQLKAQIKTNIGLRWFEELLAPSSGEGRCRCEVPDPRSQIDVDSISNKKKFVKRAVHP
jgi:hypothetical protein